MKIIVDAFGGDYSPVETVLGAVDALNAKSSLKVVLVGDKDKILSVLDGQRYDAERVEIVHAPDVVTNDDVPTTAIKTKKTVRLSKVSNFSQATTTRRALCPRVQREPFLSARI